MPVHEKTCLAPAVGICQDDAVSAPRPYSLVIVVHNHRATLEVCLNAVARLEPAPERIVVIDNASADGSWEIADGFRQTLPLDLVGRADNLGFAAAVNLALRCVETPWVLSLNPDCAPQPAFVARLLEAVETTDGAHQIGAATGRLLRGQPPRLEPDGRLDAAGMIVTPSGRHLDRGAGEPDDGRYGGHARVFGGTGAATLYRREALADIAYPDGQTFAETFFAYREDAELAWRLQWRGWACLYVPKAVAVHARGLRPEGGRRGHRDVNAHSVRNRFLLRLHCADISWHLRCFPSWLVRDLLVIGACLTVERSSLSGLVQVFRLLGDARRRRQWVMSRRVVSSRQIGRWFRRRGWVEEKEHA